MTHQTRGSFAPYLLAVLVAAGSMSCAPQGILGTSGNWKRGTTAHFISVGGIPRQYLIHVPDRRPMTLGGVIRPYPLVLVLHGSSASGEDIRQVSRMDSLSELGRFVVAYPYGTNGGGLGPTDWNAGTCCGAPERNNIDDVGFLAAVIAEASKNLTVDSHRIYIMGFSSGALMTYHAACKLAPMIAAIGVISGSLTDNNCAPARPVAVIGIHGTNDDQVGYNDPTLTPPPAPVTGAGAQLPPSAQFWVATNGCTQGAAFRQSPHVVRTTFKVCSKGPQVVFYTIEGGTHGWPASDQGPPMSELQASSVISQYFERQFTR
jgi:polyhydroxybutyrate depolymerase